MNFEDPESVVLTLAVSLLLGYGLARAGSAGMNELRNAVFARVAQHSIRSIAEKVFRHLHNLDLVRNNSYRDSRKIQYSDER